MLDLARRGLTTTLGIGVLVFQHAQVQRQELAKSAPRLVDEVSKAVGNRLKTLGEKLADLDGRAEEIFDDIEQRLPEQVRATARQTHTTLRDIRNRVGDAEDADRADGAEDADRADGAEDADRQP